MKELRDLKDLTIHDVQLMDGSGFHQPLRKHQMLDFSLTVLWRKQTIGNRGLYLGQMDRKGATLVLALKTQIWSGLIEGYLAQKTP